MKKPRKLSNFLRDSLSTLIVIVGLLGLFYPTISNYLNERNASRAVDVYDTAIQEMEEERRQQILNDAYAYNERILERNGYEVPPADENQNYIKLEGYDDRLRLGNETIMGYLTIPKLSQKVPIYHGSSEAILQMGIGHMENTSLPVGGESTHAVLTGHRGLPSKQLFTDLDQMKIGDVFYISVLGEKLAYEIDQILTVLPSEMDAIAISEGQDYVTLVTCTPYGVNTHRLLVRGKRIVYGEAEWVPVDVEEEKPEGPVITQAQKELYIGILILVIFFFVRFLISLIKKIKKRKRQRNLNNEKKIEV